MAERSSTDAAHDNDRRGEHRYPDTHQTESEQASRAKRDALKEHLGRPGQQGAARREREEPPGESTPQ